MLKPGEEIDVWVVDAPLGQGGMGSVYRCHNREAKRILAAVKVLDASIGRLPLAKARFVREAEILFSLDHPGIVKVRNVRMDLTMPYLEMEYIDGENLETRMHAGPMPLADALPVFVQVAAALKYLHAHGIRHRDVKPSNIVVQASGTIKLVDFGIATEADGATITQAGQTFGSVSYAPPEWLDPEHLDPVRWDIYAAGVVFYEVLTGRQAFAMSSTGTIQQQVVRMMAVKQRHPPLDPGPGTPRGLRALIRDMTQPHWENRVAEASSVVERLADVDMADLDMTEVASLKNAPTWYGEEDLAVRPPAGATMVPDFGELPPSGAPNLAEHPAPTDQATAAPGGSAPEVAARAPAATTPTATTPAPSRAAPTVVLPPGPATGAPPPEPRSRVGLVFGLGAATLAMLGAGAALAWTVLAPPPTRDLVVVLDGLTAEQAAGVTLDGARASAVDGPRHQFVAVEAGPHLLRAALGAECAAADSDPPWCTRVDAPVELERGHTPFEHHLTLVAPAPRALELAVAGLPADTLLHARAAEGEPATGTATSVTLPDLAPGRHAVQVWAGTCTEADAGCAVAETPCPDGCSSWRGELILPAGEGPHHVDIALPAPTLPKPVAGAGNRATLDRSTPRAGGKGKVVTFSAFARWLSSHAAWAPDAARGAGKADEGYLSGWDGATPPDGKSSQAVVNVSWAAADAYCASRGGLPAVDDAPQTWTESTTQPWHEYRQDAGRPAWRRNDGTTSTAVKRQDSRAFIGFRCAR